jgi:isopenicillin-N N-acyltransferase-like protein
MSVEPLPLEIVRVGGDARAMGRGQGEALAARIHAFLQMRWAAVDAYARERGAAGSGGLLDLGRAAYAIYAGWDPTGDAEHRGIAEAAGVDPAELYTITNMTDLRDALLLGGPPRASIPPADAEGCSSILVPGAHTNSGQPLAGQTWDLNPPDVDFIVAVNRVPTEGPETFGITCAGCLSLVGMNAHGLAVGTTNIKTWHARPGVGYLGLIHRALRSSCAQEAAALIEAAPRAGAHTYWLADARAQIELECAPHMSFRRDTSLGPVWRTNHCVAPDLVAIQGEAPTASSQARFERIGAWLALGPQSVERLRALFADRSDGVCSVNRYAEDGQGTATNGVFLAEPAAGRAHACRGPADRGAWVTFEFGGAG